MAAKKKLVRKRVKRERSEAGPREWLFPMLESAYTKLIPRAQAEREERRGRARPPGGQPVRGLPEALRRAAPGKRKSLKARIRRAVPMT